MIEDGIGALYKEEGAFAIEHLDPIVAGVGHVDGPLGRDGDAGRTEELPGTLPRLAPLGQRLRRGDGRVSSTSERSEETQHKSRGLHPNHGPNR